MFFGTGYVVSVTVEFLALFLVIVHFFDDG